MKWILITHKKLPAFNEDVFLYWKDEKGVEHFEKGNLSSKTDSAQGLKCVWAIGIDEHSAPTHWAKLEGPKN